MNNTQKFFSILAVFIYSAITIIPIVFAIDRLILVSGFNPILWIQSLDQNYVSQNSITFTFVQAFFSTILTVLIGFPVAWVLGRYSWPFKAFLRSILTLPFVIPAIIAAMGFLTITGPYGLDVRTDESNWWWTLIFYHAWFNIALIIRFCEPVLSTLNPNFEEQIDVVNKTISEIGADNKPTILITGNRKGIGLHLTKYFINKSYNVIGCSRSKSDFEHPNHIH